MELRASNMTLAAVTLREQRARHKAFHDKIKERAEALRISKLPSPAAPYRAPSELPPILVYPWIPEEPPAKPQITIGLIQRAVSERTGVPLSDFTSAIKQAPAVRARQIGMYLCRALTPHSLPAIGRHFGGRDHATIIHGLRWVKNRLRLDADLAFEVAFLFEQLTGVQQ